MIKKQTSIVDWFDVQKTFHLEAFVRLEETGHWPINFVPKNIEFPVNWQLAIIRKLAYAYLQEKHVKSVFGGGTVRAR